MALFHGLSYRSFELPITCELFRQTQHGESSRMSWSVMNDHNGLNVIKYICAGC